MDEFIAYIDHDCGYEATSDDPQGLAWAEAQLAYWD